MYLYKETRISPLMIPYVPPEYESCPHCGIEIVQEYGVLEGWDYRRGIVSRHVCDFSNLKPAPFNEREYLALLRQLQEQTQVEQATPPVAVTQQRKERRKYVGGIGL